MRIHSELSPSGGVFIVKTISKNCGLNLQKDKPIVKKVCIGNHLFGKTKVKRSINENLNTLQKEIKKSAYIGNRNRELFYRISKFVTNRRASENYIICRRKR